MTTIDTKILNRVLSLEAYFTAGAKEAAMLRKELEAGGQSSAPRKGISPEFEAEIKAKRAKKQLRKQYVK